MANNAYSYAIGRRKASTARVKLFHGGKGTHTISHNGTERSLQDFFGGNGYLFDTATAAFFSIEPTYLKKFDSHITVHGGGIAGVADAIKLAFARALIIHNSDYRPTLKPLGLLKRDARIKERKKPGLKKARKGPTWSKR